jgi:hypothetical protein
MYFKIINSVEKILNVHPDMLCAHTIFSKMNFVSYVKILKELMISYFKAPKIIYFPQIPKMSFLWDIVSGHRMFVCTPRISFISFCMAVGSFGRAFWCTGRKRHDVVLLGPKDFGTFIFSPVDWVLWSEGRKSYTTWVVQPRSLD